MRVLVTGWDGLLGTSLVRLLQERHEVVGIGVADGEISDVSFVRSRLEAFDPDAVVHLAAMTAVDACEGEEADAFRINAEGSRVVAAEAERSNASVLALSTDYVFDGKKATPYGEEDPPRPLSVYGRSKLAGEEAVRAAATRWAVVRSAWLFGPGGRNFVSTVLDLLASRPVVHVVRDQVGSPTYSLDLAKALVTLVERRARGTYHVVNRGSASWFDLARAAAEAAGLDPERVQPTRTKEMPRPALRPAYSVLDAARVRERHGIELRPWREALREYVTARRAHEAAKETG